MKVVHFSARTKWQDEVQLASTLIIMDNLVATSRTCAEMNAVHCVL